MGGAGSVRYSGQGIGIPLVIESNVGGIASLLIYFFRRSGAARTPDFCSAGWDRGGTRHPRIGRLVALSGRHAGREPGCRRGTRSTWRFPRHSACQRPRGTLGARAWSGDMDLGWNCVQRPRSSRCAGRTGVGRPDNFWIGRNSPPPGPSCSFSAAGQSIAPPASDSPQFGMDFKAHCKLHAKYYFKKCRHVDIHRVGYKTGYRLRLPA
jgi:hypothetical protein